MNEIIKTQLIGKSYKTFEWAFISHDQYYVELDSKVYLVTAKGETSIIESATETTIVNLVAYTSGMADLATVEEQFKNIRIYTFLLEEESVAPTNASNRNYLRQKIRYEAKMLEHLLSNARRLTKIAFND